MQGHVLGLQGPQAACEAHRSRGLVHRAPEFGDRRARRLLCRGGGVRQTSGKGQEVPPLPARLGTENTYDTRTS